MEELSTWYIHGFENQASEIGQFGGIVNGSVRPELMARIDKDLSKTD